MLCSTFDCRIAPCHEELKEAGNFADVGRCRQFAGIDCRFQAVDDRLVNVVEHPGQALANQLALIACLDAGPLDNDDLLV